MGLFGLVKVGAAVAVVAVLVVDVGSPVVVRLQLDDVAHDAADRAGRELRRHGERAALAEARLVVENRGASLDDFTVNREGRVELTVSKVANAYVLDRIDRLRSWYDVEVDAASAIGEA